MTLTERVEQFLYTHPVQHHQKALIEMVREGEQEYLRRIAALEKPTDDQSLVKEFERMIAEGGKEDAKADDMSGTRYFDPGF